jgi:hypothetical protein
MLRSVVFDEEKKFYEALVRSQKGDVVDFSKYDLFLVDEESYKVERAFYRAKKESRWTGKTNVAFIRSVDVKGKKRYICATSKESDESDTSISNDMKTMIKSLVGVSGIEPKFSKMTLLQILAQIVFNFESIGSMQKGIEVHYCNIAEVEIELSEFINVFIDIPNFTQFSCRSRFHLKSTSRLRKSVPYGVARGIRHLAFGVIEVLSKFSHSSTERTMRGYSFRFACMKLPTMESIDTQVFVDGEIPLPEHLTVLEGLRLEELLNTILNLGQVYSSSPIFQEETRKNVISSYLKKTFPGLIDACKQKRPDVDTPRDIVEFFYNSSAEDVKNITESLKDISFVKIFNCVSISDGIISHMTANPLYFLIALYNHKDLELATNNQFSLLDFAEFFLFESMDLVNYNNFTLQKEELMRAFRMELMKHGFDKSVTYPNATDHLSY